MIVLSNILRGRAWRYTARLVSLQGTLFVSSQPISSTVYWRMIIVSTAVLSVVLSASLALEVRVLIYPLPVALQRSRLSTAVFDAHIRMLVEVLEIVVSCLYLGGG
jgi:hypothetical protein